MSKREIFQKYVLDNSEQIDFALSVRCNMRLDYDAMGGSIFVGVNDYTNIYITPYFDGVEDLFFVVYKDGWEMPKEKFIEFYFSGDLPHDFKEYIDQVILFIEGFQREEIELTKEK